MRPVRGLRQADDSTLGTRIAVSAGELSGDRQAAAFVRELRAMDPTAIVKGMGGRNLREVGVEIIVDAERSGGLNGFNLPLIIFRSVRALFAMILLLWRWQPDVLVIVDYPDFNLRLARWARWLGIPVLCFIPPKVWAWRAKRVKTIKRVCQKAALIFPFEEKFLKDRGYERAVFVGHPLADDLSLGRSDAPEREALCRELGLDVNGHLLAVFVGSRESEVRRHVVRAVEAVRLLREFCPTVQAVFVRAPSLPARVLIELMPSEEWLKVYDGDSRRVLAAADIGLLKSGTCNLEAAFCALPFVCFYATSAMSAWIVRRFLKIVSVSPVNIVRQNTVPELLQEQANPQQLALALRELIDNPKQYRAQQQGLAEVATALRCNNDSGLFIGRQTSGARVAALALDMGRKHPRASFRRVLQYLRPYRLQFLAALGAMVVYGASDGVIPFLVKHVLDGIFSRQDRDLLYMLPVALVCFAVVRAVSDFGQQFLMARLGHNIVRDLRNRLNRHLLRLAPDFFIKSTTGNLLSRITSDVALVRELLTTSLASVLRDSVRIVALLIAAVYLDPLLAAIAFLVFPIGLLPVYKFGKRMRGLSKRGQDAVGAISALLQETITGHKVVRIFGREDFEAERFEIENERLNDTFVKSERVRAITGPINEVLAALVVSGVILYGGHTVISGIRSQGEFMAFLVSVFLLYDPFKKLSRVNNTVQQGMAGAERIFEILDTKSTITTPLSPVSLGAENTVELKNVTFSYPGAEEPALVAASLKVKEGQKVALVGFSGAGKTTLIDLIPRFIDPQEGAVLVGDTDVRRCSIRELRERIALVGQHTFLFNDTIFNNIAYGRAGATREEVMAAARAAYAYEFVMRLPNGFETIAGEGGYSLSGGERQRIAIARAILKDAPILILDEATASLDNRSEREVQAALERLEKNRTTLVIAHRLSTVRNADIIYVLERGRIVEEGTNDALLARRGTYARLYELQFLESKESSTPDLAKIQ